MLPSHLNGSFCNKISAMRMASINEDFTEFDCIRLFASESVSSALNMKLILEKNFCHRLVEGKFLVRMTILTN